MSVLEIVRETETGDHVRDLRLRSAAMGREVSARILTPPGWRPGDSDRWPVLYLLHGSSDGPRSWTTHTGIAEHASRAGVLAVLPEAGRVGYYTDWQVPDRAGTIPRWETFHLVEIRQLLENRYGASDTRIAAGLSMGGYGALMYAVRNPGLFRTVASFSGLMHISRRGWSSILAALMLKEGERPGTIWGPRRRSAQRWAANDPYLLADRLRGTDIYLAAGDGSRVPGEERVPGMGLIERLSRSMSEDLATKLFDLDIPVTTDFGPGTHFWTTWRRMVDSFGPYLRSSVRAAA
ncbi:MAG: esterase family protein [Pseudonocardiaceae bacterium]|nr:esterase family protein [Pseudonocardiaceae bacterium]